MLASRLISFPVLLAVAAGCASSTWSPRTAITPERGPVAHLHATYSGGLTNRFLRASFKVDRNAYVLVGHLGGDGLIEILYTENARESNFVRAGTTYSTAQVSAMYEGVPQLFNYTSRAFRSIGARTDSYDGRGNGFVFIIANRVPLYLEPLQENGYWNNDYQVANYSWSSDPREAIRYFADAVAMGGPYSLKYANSFGTNALSSYATQQMDCAVISSALGFGNLFLEPGFGFLGGGFSAFSWYTFGNPVWGLANSNWYAFYGALAPGYGCGRGGFGRGLYAGATRWGTLPPGYLTESPTAAPKPTTPVVPAFTPRRLPGTRVGNESGPAVLLSRTRFERPREGQTSWTPRGSHEPERYRAPDRWREPERYNPSPSAGSSYSPRAPMFESPRGGSSAAPAAPAPSSPPPKVEAASAGKPREP